MPSSSTYRKLMKYTAACSLATMLVLACRKQQRAKRISAASALYDGNICILTSADMKDSKLTPAGRVQADTAALTIAHYCGDKPIRVLCTRWAKGYQTAAIVAAVLGVKLELVDWANGPRDKYEMELAALRWCDPLSVLVVTREESFSGQSNLPTLSQEAAQRVSAAGRN